MKYSECKPIKTRTSSVWEIELSDKTHKLLVLDKEFDAVQVIDMIKVLQHNKPASEKKFRISAVDVGIFNLDKKYPTEHSYKSDSRWLTQNHLIEIN